MSIDLLFLVVGISLSFFYGLCSYRIFTYPHTDEVYTKNNLNRLDVTNRARFHEGWVYFVCSILGWLCLYVLYSDLFKEGLNNFDIGRITANHFLLLLISILGIIGFMPRALWNFTEIVSELTKKLTK